MRFAKICIFIFFVSFLLFFRPSETRAVIRDRVVAIVNDNIITLHELNKKLKEVSGLDPEALKKENEKKYFRARWKILDMLIDERLAAAKAKELGIIVTPDEVDKAIERIKRQNGITQEMLVASLKDRGMTYKQYRDKMKKELQRVSLINYEVKSKIVIQDKKIKEYYEGHKKEFTSQGEVHLAAIFLKKRDSTNPKNDETLLQQARNIISKLNGGADFGDLAGQYSQGPGAEDRGDLGFFKTSQLDTVLAKAVDPLPEGGISAPIIRDSGIQIVKVIERRKAGLRPFAQVKEQIYDTLYRAEVNKRYVSWIRGLREKAYIKILF